MSFLRFMGVSLIRFACRVEGGSVPAVYVFGDSTADVGNNNYLPEVGMDTKCNFPYYGIDYPGALPTGRFNNGYNGVDILAKMLGFNQSPPPYLSIMEENEMEGGVNFASGGSGILDATGGMISFTRQIKDFEDVINILAKRKGAQAASALLSKSLFLISTGNNDMFAYYFTTGLQNMTRNEYFISSLVLKFEDQLTQLHKLGARKFGIFGTSRIGCIPYLRSINPSGSCVEELSQLARMFNKAAKQQLEHLSATLEGMKYSYANAYYTMSLVQDKPHLFGYKELKIGCCGSGRFNAETTCTPNTTYCKNRDEYYFWDRFHPTQATYELVANKSFSGTKRFATPINFKQLVEYPSFNSHNINVDDY